MAHSKLTDQQVLDLLSKAVGPAPWYTPSFADPSVGGVALRWRRAKPPPGFHPGAELFVESDPDRVLLELSMYARAIRLDHEQLGVWFERGRSIHLVAFDCAELHRAAANGTRERGVSPKQGFRTTVVPIAEFRVPLHLERGEHRVNTARAIDHRGEILVIGSYEVGHDIANAAIFSVNFGPSEKEASVRVYPQRWFTAEACDLGYQWITRVAREPRTGRLVGDGIRISPFVLDSDGILIERWLPPT